MELSQLVEEAKEKDPKFRKQMDYRIANQQVPKLNWLMGRLVEILGESYVRQAAQVCIENRSKAAQG